MVIKFDNVTYKENIMTPLEKTYIKNLSLIINENKITSFIGDSESGIYKLGDLINASSYVTSGKIKVLNYINDGRTIKKVNILRMNVGLVKLNKDEMLFNKTVKDELEFGIKYFKYKTEKKSVRVPDALKLVGLTSDYLEKNIKDLTLSEIRKVSLASVLIFNPSIIIIEEPTYGLQNKDREDLKKLLTMLKTKYNKTIILLTKDTDFIYGLTDEVFIMNKGSIVSHGGKELLENEDLINTYNLKAPEIIRFINYANKKNANLTYTSNILDLIKEVYRNAF